MIAGERLASCSPGNVSILITLSSLTLRCGIQTRVSTASKCPRIDIKTPLCSDGVFRMQDNTETTNLSLANTFRHARTTGNSLRLSLRRESKATLGETIVHRAREQEMCF